MKTLRASEIKNFKPTYRIGEFTDEACNTYKDVLLCIPPIKLGKFKVLTMELWLNNSIKLNFEMRTIVETPMNYTTKQYIYGLHDLIHKSGYNMTPLNVRIIIRYEFTVLYDSKETLNRDMLLFDTSMKEVRTRKNPANKWYFIYTDCGKGDITTPMFNTITLAPYSNSLGIYELYAGVCDNVSINETEYFFE